MFRVFQMVLRVSARRGAVRACGVLKLSKHSSVRAGCSGAWTRTCTGSDPAGSARSCVLRRWACVRDESGDPKSWLPDETDGGVCSGLLPLYSGRHGEAQPSPDCRTPPDPPSSQPAPACSRHRPRAWGVGRRSSKQRWLWSDLTGVVRISGTHTSRAASRAHISLAMAHFLLLASIFPLEWSKPR